MLFRSLIFQLNFFSLSSHFIRNFLSLLLISSLFSLLSLLSLLFRWLGFLLGFWLKHETGLDFWWLGFLGFAVGFCSAWAWVLPVGFSGFCRLGFGAQRGGG